MIEAKEKYKIMVISILLAGACLLTYYFHVVLDNGRFFTHFFYIPIILACIWWKRKGLAVAIFLAVFLIFSHNFFRGAVETVNDYPRALMFIVIAIVIATLSEKIAKKGEALRELNEELEERVDARTKEPMKANEQLKQEITGHKKAEEALRESEERFRTIVETAPSLLIITDAEGNNIYVSPNCEEITGYTQEELRGEPRWWMHEDDTRRALELFERTFCEGIGYKNFEYKIVKKNGEVRHASSSWKPLKDGEGKFKGIVFQTIDITECKKAEDKVKEAYRLREHFLKETSHRIITPVAIIGGNTDLLLERGNLDDDQKEKIRIIRERNEEVQKLVRDALAGKYLEEEEGGEG